MVCAEERKKFPFDVGHRRIIRYSSISPSRFEKLKEEIAAALNNIERSERAIQQIEEAGVLADKEGLSAHERVVAVTIASEFSEGAPGLGDYFIKSRCARTGMTDLAVVLALRKLKRKFFVEVETDTDDDGRPFAIYALTDKAWDWILENEEDFVLEKPARKQPPRDPDLDAEPDDIPF